MSASPDDAAVLDAADGMRDLAERLAGASMMVESMPSEQMSAPVASFLGAALDRMSDEASRLADAACGHVPRNGA